MRFGCCHCSTALSTFPDASSTHTPPAAMAVAEGDAASRRCLYRCSTREGLFSILAHPHPRHTARRLGFDTPPMRSRSSAECDAMKDFGDDLCRLRDRHSGTVEE